MEDFADRTLRLTCDGYPNTPEDMIQSLAIDSFIRACREKNAAFMTMEKDPETVYEALKLLKSTIHNQKALTTPNAYFTRQVNFDLDVGEDSSKSVRGLQSSATNTDQLLVQFTASMTAGFEKMGQLLTRRSGSRDFRRWEGRLHPPPPDKGFVIPARSQDIYPVNVH